MTEARAGIRGIGMTSARTRDRLVQRLVDQANSQQQLVEQAIVFENANPGVNAQQKTGPERQDNQHQQRHTPVFGGPGNGIRHWVTKQQTEQGRHRSDTE